LRPTSGRAVVAGHDVVREPARVRERIGYMSASTGIYDRMTAWELVEYFGRLYGMDPEVLRERMTLIFDWLHMNEFRNVLGAKLSTGMKQKVSIARTIVHDPPVLIFDEPTSGLDVLVARSLRRRIVELKEQGKTIVFSSHDMSEVAKLCSRVGIIHRGRLQALGAPEELLERYEQSDLEELFFHLVERADRAHDRRARAEEGLEPEPQVN
jgi:sodium transport system ATP-binding protein